MWMCKQHNLVNQKLGKPLFPCEMDILDQRWKQADPKNTNCSSSTLKDY
jgi:FAD-linked sulfhydryl oxidase